VGQVGPRSAHIAGLRYLSFADQAGAPVRAATHTLDDEAYLVIEVGGEKLAVTPTCASNRLGLVPAGDCAKGNDEILERGFDVLAEPCGLTDGAAVAEAIMTKAVPKVQTLIEGFLRDYKLDPGVVRLMGGGGGASALVPYIARQMKLPFNTVENADVISAIGVALALVRDSVERTVVQPTEDDIRQTREEAVASVLRMGAAVETVEVFVEVDAKRNLLRATAQGSTEIKEQELRPAELSEEGRRALVTASMGGSATPPRCLVEQAGFEVWSAERVIHRLWRFLPETRRAIRVLDGTGSIRWASNHADVRIAKVASAERQLEDFAEQYTQYSDAGATIPRCYALLANRIINLSGLIEMKQVLELLRIELARFGPEEPCVLLVERGSG
jgi:hypothetical protein